MAVLPFQKPKDLLHFLVVWFFLRMDGVLVYRKQVNGKEGTEIIKAVLIPALEKIMESPKMEVKAACEEQLGEVSSLMDEKDKGDQILTICLRLAHDDRNDDNKIVGLKLLTKLASNFGMNLCEQYVGLEILSMGEDPNWKVRREAVIQMPKVGQVVSPTFFEKKLLPFFKGISKDQTWGVRKACVESLVAVCQILQLDKRNAFFSEIMLDLVKDESKWVKISAFKALGPYIHSLKGGPLSGRVFESFLMMADPKVNALTEENEIAISCAFYFPAVVYTVGKQCWVQLSKVFKVFVKHKDQVSQD